MRLLLVDDDIDYLDLCQRVAQKDPVVQIVATCTRGGDALSVAHEHRPDVTLLDLALPDVDGLSLIVGLTEAGTRTVVVTENDYEPLRELALANGADGFVTKAPVTTLFERLRQQLDATP